jgi:hypothetical protein
MNKTKLKEEIVLWQGVGLGFLGGIAGNIFVTAMYRVVDNPDSQQDVATFLLGLASLVVILGLAFFMIKYNEHKLSKK